MAKIEMEELQESLSLFEKSVNKILDFFSQDQSKFEGKTVAEICKSVDKEKQLFTAVVLRPNTVDAHGDIYDEEVVEKACHDYNVLCRKANLQHLVEIEKAFPVESYIAPANFKLGDGEVQKGDWVMTMKIEDQEVWEACKDGTFTGFSVGCRGKVENL